MSSLSTIITDTYWDTRKNQMGAQLALEQADINPHIFSTDADESQAKKEASSLYFWRTFMVDVPRRVGGVFSQHQKDMIQKRAADIERAEFDMFYEWLVRFEWFMKPYRFIAVSESVQEILGLREKSNNSTH